MGKPLVQGRHNPWGAEIVGGQPVRICDGQLHSRLVVKHIEDIYRSLCSSQGTLGAILALCLQYRRTQNTPVLSLIYDTADKCYI